VDVPLVIETPAVETSEPEKKKDKKKKSKPAETEEPIAAVETSIVDIVKPEKKKKKKPKTEDGEDIPAPVVDIVKLEGKKKKSKKPKQEVEAASHEETTSVAEQWNPDALTGDAARQEKFLRLLGAKKPGAISSKSSKSSKKIEDVAKIEMDLEKQYEAGIKHKHGSGSKHMGLGA